MDKIDVLKSLKTPCHWLGASERNLEWGDNRLSSAVARAYNGGLGAESPAGLHGAELPMGNQGAKPPEAEKLSPFACLVEGANLSYFLFIYSFLHVQARTDV